MGQARLGSALHVADTDRAGAHIDADHLAAGETNDDHVAAFLDFRGGVPDHACRKMSSSRRARTS